MASYLLFKTLVYSHCNDKLTYLATHQTEYMKLTVRAVTINAILSVFILTVCNVSFWQHYAEIYPLTISNLPLVLALSVGLWCFFYLTLTLVSFKYIYKPMVFIILLISVLSAYAMDTHGYIIFSSTFINIIETETHELHELLTWKLLTYIGLLVVLPSIIIFSIKIIYPTHKSRLLTFILMLAILASDIFAFKKEYIFMLKNHREIRYYLNPVRTIYSLNKFIGEHYKNTEDISFKILDPAPVISERSLKPRLVVLVIGEADRAANHSLNGYNRMTNPLLSQRSDVYSFKEFYSCGTETAVSVPCMLSSYKREDFTHNKGRYTQNLLDILQAAQVQVIWRDNDSGCKSICNRVTYEDFNNETIAPFCNDTECHDEVLLHDLQKHMQNDVRDKLIVLHKMGNHGPAYYKRYPQQFEVFTPTCKSHELQECSREDIVNAYDNIVVYTDYFLDKIISQLEEYSEQYDSAMIYVSDHGESLGEHGIYLHAMPYMLAPKEQTHIPFILWASAGFNLKHDQLAILQQEKLSHDNLYHVMLGLYGVDSITYDKELDFLS